MEENQRIVIQSADVPNQTVEKTVHQGSVIVQLVASSFGGGLDMFKKGKKLNCRYRLIGPSYTIKERGAYVTLHEGGCFTIVIDPEIIGSVIEFKIMDVNLTLRLKTCLRNVAPHITSVCWKNDERQTADKEQTLNSQRHGNIYANEDAFLHCTSCGMFGRTVVIDILETGTDKHLLSESVLIKKNCSLKVLSMSEIGRAFERIYAGKLLFPVSFYARIDANGKEEDTISSSLSFVPDILAESPVRATSYLGMVKTVIGEKEEGKNEDEKKYEDVKMALFFDGTDNNKDNVEARMAYEKMDRGEPVSSREEEAATAYGYLKGMKDRIIPGFLAQMGSYGNEKSNIAKLWDAYDKEIGKKIYVEGIGTEKFRYDNLRGMGMGTGSTGIVAKVENGIEKIIDNLELRILINELILDVYGFSRGAAAARHFVAEVTQHGILGRTEPYGKLGRLLKENGIKVKKVTVRFTGLMDTVSSYGLNFSDDVEELQLDKVYKSHRVVQLAAADEYRKNYSLTHITGCNGRGWELYLPGAHADIGGGYLADDVAEHDKTLLKAASSAQADDLKQHLMDEGWYTEEELKKLLAGFASCNSSIYELHGSRHISNLYAHIPLHIMKELSEKLTREACFDNDKFNRTYTIDSSLLDVYTCLMEYVNDGQYTTAPDSYKKYFEGKEDLLKTLRNRHLHWSSEPGMLNGANIENGTLKRKNYEDS